MEEKEEEEEVEEEINHVRELEFDLIIILCYIIYYVILCYVILYYIT